MDFTIIDIISELFQSIFQSYGDKTVEKDY